MAEVLTTLGWLVLGVAIGWRFRRRADARQIARATTDLLAAEWAEHVRLHAEGLNGSVVWTAPEAAVLPELDPQQVAAATRKYDQRFGS